MCTGTFGFAAYPLDAVCERYRREINATYICSKYFMNIFFYISYTCLFVRMSLTKSFDRKALYQF